MPEKRMQMDTVYRPPFGYIASEACATDGRKESFANFRFFLRSLEWEKKEFYA